jgi:23S rRNA pseudouridine2605 synthase
MGGGGGTGGGHGRGAGRGAPSHAQAPSRGGHHSASAASFDISAGMAGLSIGGRDRRPGGPSTGGQGGQGGRPAGSSVQGGQGGRRSGPPARDVGPPVSGTPPRRPPVREDLRGPAGRERRTR